jgi:hypothetical protein
MYRIAVAALAGALLVGCAAPASAPAPLPRPAPSQPAADAAWSDDLALATLRAALGRRGHLPEVVDGPMAPLSFDAGKVVVHQDGGAFETVAGGGAWLVATHTGAFWVFQSGVVLPADPDAAR